MEGHLYETVALEEQGRNVPLDLSDARRLPRRPEDLVEQASKWVRRTTAASDLRPVDTLPGLFVLLSGDGLAASRMRLLPELLDRPALGGMVVAVPGPDQLLCVPMHSAGSIDALQTLASALGHAATHRDEVLSDQLFWHDGERWVLMPVQHGTEDITVLPPPAFVANMNRLAAMDLVQLAGEA